jgi:hypothetical protein
MRFAEWNELAEFRDKDRPCDMTIYVGTHFACLPSEQAPSHAWDRSRDFEINLLAQQRGSFEYRAMNRLFMIQLTDSRIEHRDYLANPFA